MPADHDDAALAVAGVALGACPASSSTPRSRRAPAGRLGGDDDDRAVRTGPARDDELAHGRSARRTAAGAGAAASYSARAARTGVVAADLGDRHVPPRLVARHAGVAVGLDVHDDRAAAVPRASRERAAQLGDRARAQHARAEALGVRGQVDRQRRRVVAPSSTGSAPSPATR